MVAAKDKTNINKYYEHLSSFMKSDKRTKVLYYKGESVYDKRLVGGAVMEVDRFKGKYEAWWTDTGALFNDSIIDERPDIVAEFIELDP